jgi:hypothetical protein
MHLRREVVVRTHHNSSADREALVLYGLLAFIGLIPVVVTIADATVFGFDATLGLFMLAIGAVGLTYELFRTR